MRTPTYYDDNYGHWDDMDDPDMVAFYHAVARDSVRKKCQRCNRTVKLRHDYYICNSCADALERGGDF